MWPEGNIAQQWGHNFSVLIEANSRYLFGYITENSKNMSAGKMWNAEYRCRTELGLGTGV